MLKDLDMKPQGNKSSYQMTQNSEKKLNSVTEATYMGKLIDRFIMDGFSNWSRYFPTIADTSAPPPMTRYLRTTPEN